MAAPQQMPRQTRNDSEAESLLQRRLAQPIIDRFRPLYDRNPRCGGFVSLQGDPSGEEDSEVILREARANESLRGERHTQKIFGASAELCYDVRAPEKI